MSTHQEKQRIFDEYAKSVGFGCFDNILKHYQKYDAFLTKGLEEHIFAACDLVQEEQQKRIADNVKVHIVDVDRYGDETIIEKCDSSGFPLMYAKEFSEDNNIAVDLNSITNPENLIS